MADIFIPKIFDQLTDIALKKIQERVNLVVGAEEEVEKLSKTLKTLETVLCDAERRRLEDDGVRVWLEMLDDIAYEMEDVLEEWNVKIVKTKEAEPEPRQKHTLMEKVRMYIQSFCSCLKQVPLRSEFGLKIKEINDKLDSILAEAHKFRFMITRTTPSKNPFSGFKQPPTLSNVNETKVHGRENDKDILLEHLLFDQEVVQGNRFKVISIVGLGGSGKTTLAQFLYNDERVRNHFNLQKWVCVSDPFDEIRIAKSLVETPGNDVSNLAGENLFPLVKSLFSKKRFLLVLDDVWTEDSSRWEQITLSFKDCDPGSVVLVTTRNEWVARAIGTRTHFSHKLGFLESSHCWFIIKQVALSERSDLCPMVEKIGKAIADKCKGLPLAAKTLGGVLLFKDTPREWQDILDSNIWRMEKPAMDLFPHFYLSYKELSPEMKRCFSFCAIYPKDQVIDTDHLVKMWMAQGYLGGGERMEMKGSEFVKNLAVHSFFQELKESDDGAIFWVKMHDLVHDFAQFLVRGECKAFVEGEANRGNIETRPCRHVMASGKVESILNFLVTDVGNLRTLSVENAIVPSEFGPNLCSRLKSVRTLILRSLKMKEFPQDIASLIHLRYLDVSHNLFSELPETICDLHYMESLDVSSSHLAHLPKRFGDLGQLRHLLNYDGCGLKQTQHGIERLTSLRVVKKMMLQDDGSPMDFLAKLVHLEDLRVYFDQWGDLRSMDVALLEVFEHAPHLQKLTVEAYRKLPFHKRIVSRFVTSSITHLLIEDCCDISSMPLGKLPSLQHLNISFTDVKHMGRDFYGLSSDADVHTEKQRVAFPVLRTLYMYYVRVDTWEDIDEEDHNVSIMPLLEKLTIIQCRNLTALPRQILERASCLRELCLSNCDGLRIEESWMRELCTFDFRVYKIAT